MSRTSLCLWAVALVAAGAGFAEAPGSLRLPPEECVRLLRTARISHMDGDTAAELDHLHQAAKAFPEEIAPIYGLLEYHRNHGLPDSEVRELRALLVRRLEDAESALPVGVLAWIARDPGADEATLRTVVEIVTQRLGNRPEADTELLAMMASLQQRLGLDEAAVETLERLEQVQPSEITRWTLALLYFRLERWGPAADLLGAMIDSRTVHLRNTYIRALGKAGRVEEQSRQIELLLAESLSDEADLDDHASYHKGLDAVWTAAWEMRDAGNDEEAERLFRRILEIDPDSEKTRAALTYLYGTAEERQALAAAQAERRSKEDDPQALFDEGTQLLTAGDAEAAIDLLRRAAPALSDLEAAWYNLGMAAYRLEDWETVVSAFGRAGELNPERAATFFFRGLALAKLERCSEAVSALERAVDLDPERTLAHYHLWVCYSALGDSDAASRHRRLYDAAGQ